MPRSWPIDPEHITLRVCADLDWRVSAHCPNCRIGSDVRLEKFAHKPIAAVPLARLLKVGAFTCKTRCGGLPASSVDVTAMDVGMSHYVARYRIDPASAARSVMSEGPARD
jgi:hypothetical protein